MKTESKQHTAGPWELRPYGKSIVLIFGKHLVITVDHREDFGDAMPDAQLIAAVHEMAEALRAVVKAEDHDLDDDGCHYMDHGCDMCEALDRARDALKKAGLMRACA